MKHVTAFVAQNVTLHRESVQACWASDIHDCTLKVSVINFEKKIPPARPYLGLDI